jgi:hypothetical protein
MQSIKWTMTNYAADLTGLFIAKLVFLSNAKILMTSMERDNIEFRQLFEGYAHGLT